MKFVLDTNVVSALRVRGREPIVERWARQYSSRDFCITAFTLAELERGVINKERIDPPQGAVFRRWFEDIVYPTFSHKVLPFDLAAARVSSHYRVTEHAPLDDALIAAVTEANGLTLATRNIKHFKPLGINLVNPWEEHA